MGCELMSTLERAFLVDLEQYYQAQFVDRIQRSSELQLDDEFLAKVRAPGAGSELLPSDVELESSACQGDDDEAMAAEDLAPTTGGGPPSQDGRHDAREERSQQQLQSTTNRLKLLLTLNKGI